MIDTPSHEIHRMTPYQRCLLWVSGAMERLLALFPRPLALAERDELRGS